MYCTGPLLLVLEFAPFGNLHYFLKRNRPGGARRTIRLPPRCRAGPTRSPSLSALQGLSQLLTLRLEVRRMCQLRRLRRYPTRTQTEWPPDYSLGLVDIMSECEIDEAPDENSAQSSAAACTLIPLASLPPLPRPLSRSSGQAPASATCSKPDMSSSAASANGKSVPDDDLQPPLESATAGDAAEPMAAHSTGRSGSVFVQLTERRDGGHRNRFAHRSVPTCVRRRQSSRQLLCTRVTEHRRSRQSRIGRRTIWRDLCSNSRLTRMRHENETSEQLPHPNQSDSIVAIAALPTNAPSDSEPSVRQLQCCTYWTTRGSCWARPRAAH